MKTLGVLTCAALALLPVCAGAQGGAQGGAPGLVMGSIAGTVYDSLSTGAPLANATVVLVEQSRYATTDGRGRFRIDSVPDGHYTIAFMHPVLDSLDLEAPVVGVAVVGGRRTTVALFTPAPATAYANICRGRNDIETGVVIGRVHDVDNQAPLAGATVETDWTEFTIGGGRAKGQRARALTRTNSKGVYVLCGVPTTVQLDVRADFAGFSAGPTPLLLNRRLISRLNFAISQRDSAARGVVLGDSVSIASGTPGTASLRGRILGTNGRPLRGGVVGIVGTSRVARTDSAGEFRVDRIPAGTRTVEIRSIGLLPTSVSMDFATSMARDTTLSVSMQQALKPVTVLGRVGMTSLMERDGFDARVRQGFGTFATEADIARHGFNDLTSILQGMRGVRIEYAPVQGSVYRPMAYLLGIGISASGSSKCVPNFFLDGAPYAVASVEDYDDLSGTLPAVWIKGVEVYSNAGGTPAMYDRSALTGCGSILIWTR